MQTDTKWTAQPQSVKPNPHQHPPTDLGWRSGRWTDRWYWSLCGRSWSQLPALWAACCTGCVPRRWQTPGTAPRPWRRERWRHCTGHRTSQSLARPPCSHRRSWRSRKGSCGHVKAVGGCRSLCLILISLANPWYVWNLIFEEIHLTSSFVCWLVA